MNTNLNEALAVKERLIQSTEDEKRTDALKYEMQERELKKKQNEVISLKEQLCTLLNRDGSLRDVVKQRVIREFCEWEKSKNWLIATVTEVVQDVL